MIYLVLSWNSACEITPPQGLYGRSSVRFRGLPPFHKNNTVNWPYFDPIILLLLSMSTFIPTKEELEEMGFEGNEEWLAKFATPQTFVCFLHGNTWLIWTKPMVYMGEWINDIFRNIYPQSIEDIKTLTRIMTAPTDTL